jgi:hypothetical protein
MRHRWQCKPYLTRTPGYDAAVTAPLAACQHIQTRIYFEIVSEENKNDMADAERSSESAQARASLKSARTQAVRVRGALNLRRVDEPAVEHVDDTVGATRMRIRVSHHDDGRAGVCDIT